MAGRKRKRVLRVKIGGRKVSGPADRRDASDCEAPKVDSSDPVDKIDSSDYQALQFVDDVVQTVVTSITQQTEAAPKAKISKSKRTLSANGGAEGGQASLSAYACTSAMASESAAALPSAETLSPSTLSPQEEFDGPVDSVTTLSTPLRSSFSRDKRGRGPTVGNTIWKSIAKQGGKPLDIVFLEGYTKPHKHDRDLINGIGIIIKNHAPLKHKWSDISNDEKELLFQKLFVWFNIVDWDVDPRVHRYVEDMFKASYRRWRNYLHDLYKKMVAKGIDPRSRSPHEACELKSWHALCDLFEDEKFKKLAQKNAENRKKLLYIHTSGSKSFHTRLQEMETQSEIELFKTTHTRNGEFVSPIAKLKYEQMKENLLKHSDVAGETSISQREIVADVLNHSTTTYASGMGYGILAPKRMTKLREKMYMRTRKLEKELSTTKEALENANTLLKSYNENNQMHVERMERPDQINGQQEECSLRTRMLEEELSATKDALENAKSCMKCNEEKLHRVEGELSTANEALDKANNLLASYEKKLQRTTILEGESSTTKEALERANTLLKSYEEKFQKQEGKIERQDERIERLLQNQQTMQQMVMDFMIGRYTQSAPSNNR